MNFRIELFKNGEWVGLFRGMDYITPFEDQRRWDEANEMSRYLFRELECPNLYGCGESRSWFTELGFSKFQERLDLFLEILADESSVRDIRILESESTPEGDIIHEDRHQVIVQIAPPEATIQ